MATYSDTLLEVIKNELTEIKNLLTEQNKLMRGKAVDLNVLNEKIDDRKKFLKMLSSEDTAPQTYLAEDK